MLLKKATNAAFVGKEPPVLDPILLFYATQEALFNKVIKSL